jgi:enediyne biosynthesis protein E4
MSERIRRRWTGLGGVGAIVIAVGVYFLFLRTPPKTRAVPIPKADAPLGGERISENVTLPDVRFVDITGEAGIRFNHTNGSFGLKLLPETMGPGCAFFDYDNDGDQDILIVNSRFWVDDPDRDKKPNPTLALYSNDGTGHFTDVTKELGLGVTLFGMGVTIGDYDNDGFDDIFVTAIEMDGNRLFHNEGGKGFRDVTAGDLARKAGWSTGAAFLDANKDGKLDLFVCNYVQWTPEIDMKQGFTIDGKTRAFGPPMTFEGSFCQLFLGDGTGRFVDVSAQAGIQKANPNTGRPMGKSLGVIACDIDRDGNIDVLVANDTVQNFLFHNKGGGIFEEIGVEAGIAFDTAGRARGAMGIDCAEYRDDGKFAIAVGNFANEMTAFYVNQDRSRLFYADKATAEGVGPPGQLLLKFGLFFFDYDLDGRPDLLTANGHLEEDIGKVQASQTYAQPPQIYWNCGTEERVVFVAVPEKNVGRDLLQPMVGRGAAYADIDGDGDLDVLLAANGGSPRLLRNEGGNKHHWLRFKLEGDGVRSNRSAIGARVELKVGALTQGLEVMGGRSYLSQPESVLTFGLGNANKVDELKIFWPDGSIETLRDISADQLIHVKQTGGESS